MPNYMKNPWKSVRPRRIDPPRYKVGKYVLNEYELRYLMVQVCRGEIEPGFRVTHVQSGNSTIIRPDGRFEGRLGGLDIASGFTLDLIRHDRENNRTPS